MIWRRIGRFVVVTVVALAALAPFVASDRPIVLHYRGETDWWTNLSDDDIAGGLRGEALSARMIPDDWAVWAPIRHSPESVRSRGQVEPLAEPSVTHWLGTDDRGRDVLARLIHGSRVTVIIAALAAALSVFLALALALLAARAGGPVRAGVIAAFDAVSAVPTIIVVVALQGLTGAGGILWVALLVAIPRGADTARLTLGSLELAARSDFAAAARAAGASEWRILWRHGIPHALPHLWVAAMLTAATAVLAEAALGFLGFGAPPPTASWGELLRQAHENRLVWWLAIPPGLAIATVAASLNALAQPAGPDPG